MNMTEQNAQLEQLARRITGLYSLPAVAMEVLRLTERPDVDSEALRACLENDPALTAKVLRVVNSSLFGLSGQVADLKQALALLGTGPLKLLVLGFSLPDELFEAATKEQLRWYWTTSLTRAVAARQLSKTLWQNSGDEAFLTGLLYDIGMLALVRQLDNAFASFLNRVIADNHNLAAAEQQALGFDHVALSVALFEHWQLPKLITDAVSLPKQPLKLARIDSEAAELAKVLHLADLTSQLVSQHRICVLPDLLESGKLYRDLTKPLLFEIIAQLQPQVDQLADVLSLDLPEGRDYQSVLVEAHKQMALVAETEIGPFAGLQSADDICDALLVESEKLRNAMKVFLSTPPSTEAGHLPRPEREPQWVLPHASHERTAGEPTSSTCDTPRRVTASLLQQLITSTARGCRMRRSELSLLLVEIQWHDEWAEAERRAEVGAIMRTIESTCRGLVTSNAEVLLTTSRQLAVIASGCDRREAVDLANSLVNPLTRISGREDVPGMLVEVSIKVGAATVSGILANFSAESLIEGAERCLNAARSCGGNVVKSIEVY